MRNFTLSRGRVTYPVFDTIRTVVPGVDVTLEEYADILDILFNDGVFPEECTNDTAGEDKPSWVSAHIQYESRLLESPVEHVPGNLAVYFSKYARILTNDGHIIMFKGLNSNYKDSHTGTMDNSPGKVVSLPMEKCDTSEDRDCAAGLHAAHYKTASGFGSKMVLVVIDPADIIAVPVGYYKIRCKQYRVLEWGTTELSGAMDICASAEYWSRFDQRFSTPIVIPVNADGVTVADVVKTIDSQFSDSSSTASPSRSSTIRGNRKWSCAEDDLLLQAKKKGMDNAYIADLFLRSEEAVSRRLRRLARAGK